MQFLGCCSIISDPKLECPALGFAMTSRCLHYATVVQVCILLVPAPLANVITQLFITANALIRCCDSQNTGTHNAVVKLAVQFKAEIFTGPGDCTRQTGGMAPFRRKTLAHDLLQCRDAVVHGSTQIWLISFILLVGVCTHLGCVFPLLHRGEIQ